MYGYSMQNNMVAVQQQPYQPQMVQPQIVSLATPAQPMVKPLISPVNTQQPAVGQVWGQPANQVMVANVAAPFTNTVNVELSLKVPKSYYFAGEVIEGVAVVSSNVQTNAQVLQINLNGVMVRSVMTPHFRDEGTRNIFQRRVEVPLQGGLIPAGQVLTLPFKIQTPDRAEVISSIETSTFCVRYYIDASFPGLWAQAMPPFDYCHVYIYDYLDCNAPEARQNPGEGKLSTDAGCCGSDHIDLTFQLDRLVYMPGDVVTAHCTGNTSTSKHYLQLYFKQVDYPLTPGTSPRVKITAVDLPPPSQDEQIEIWKDKFDVSGVLPKTLLPSLRCPFVEISFAIKLAVDVIGLDPKSTDVPLLTGTVAKRHGHMPVMAEKNAIVSLNTEIENQLKASYSTKMQLPPLIHLPNDLTQRYQPLLARKIPDYNMYQAPGGGGHIRFTPRHHHHGRRFH